MTNDGKKMRGPGRPSMKSGDSLRLSEDSIIAAALELTKTLPVSDVSIKRLSQSMGVSAPAIHYYVDGRAGLTSAIINRFYGQLYRQCVAVDAEGVEWIEIFCRKFLDILLIYRGVPGYLMTENRHRIVQSVGPDGSDFGSMLFVMAMNKLGKVNAPVQRIALILHLLLQHVLSTAHAEAANLLPAANAEFLKRNFESALENHSVRLGEAFMKVDVDHAFEGGLSALLAHLDV